VSRSVVVTGACGGIGRAVAAYFRRSGWTVIGVDRREPDDGVEIDRFELSDVGRDGEVAALFDRLSDVPSLDALVNNAAVQVNKPLVETTDDDWNLVIDTNVRSAFQCIREAHPRLAAARGAVVNISSVHAIATSINVAAYAISKGALAALTRSAAIELAADGIRCNAVLPGAVDTAMLRDGLDRRPHADGPDGNLADLAARTPLGFVATADQIAPSVLHLADGDLSPYTTGQMLVVDGGATIKLGTE
jgi:NAD(P)-dependent dehydrogenase (short-subunit alcohol dehydrogenase family)